MLLEVPNLVAGLLPGLGPPERLSIAVIRSSRPVFLVFGDEPQRPACVVHIGDKSVIQKTWDVMSILRVELPDAIAEPLAMGQIDDERAVLIQSGLPGTPWFRLRDRVRGPDGWRLLRDGAVDCLTRFHQAVCRHPEWRQSVAPAKELRQRFSACVRSGVSFTEEVHERVIEYERALASLGRIEWPVQHGDFCLNNVMISDQGLWVIDFEEFGLTSVPLHDEFVLALSIFECSSLDKVRWSPEELIESCLTASPRENEFDAEQVLGLFMHQLLWRLDQTTGVPTRCARRESLVRMVEETAMSTGFPTLLPPLP